MRGKTLKTAGFLFILSFLQGCSSLSDKEPRIRPDGTPMTEYQVYENEIKDGVFYVRHSDSVCEPVYFGEADDLPEPVEKPVEEPEVTSTEGASTGIPRLDQYTNVDETENTRWRILNDEPSSYTKSCYHYYCLCRIYKHPKEE